MEEIADAYRCLLCGSGVWYLSVDKAVVLNAYLALFFGRIEGKMEEHSGVYECVYKTSPVIKGQVNVSGNFICLLLGLRGVGKLSSPELSFAIFSAS